MQHAKFENPFRPGAGHNPPYLAGRDKEKREFFKILEQKVVSENVILTGLRGVGKTVLLNEFKSLAIANGWLWVGNDLSEAASISEDTMAKRLLTDLSLVTSDVTFHIEKQRTIGFVATEKLKHNKLTYENLTVLYNSFPGLVSDKIKSIFDLVWRFLAPQRYKGIIFAYDEAQTISDQPQKEQYPVALILDVFQSIQRREIPLMLVLSGLPTLHAKLVDSRTFAERMFKVIFLTRLSNHDSQEAIKRPIQDSKCPIAFDEKSTETIVKESGGYPYFIQFMCKEVFDIFIQKIEKSEPVTVPIESINAKLDSDFFAGRWAKITDRQRELLSVIARLEHCQDEFTVQEVVEESKKLLKNPFGGNSQVNQMLSSLAEIGIVYKNRHGKYSFAVPLLEKFILRQKLKEKR